MELRRLPSTSVRPETQTLCKFIARRITPRRPLTSVSRTFIFPQAEAILGKLEVTFAAQQTARLAASGSVSSSLLTNAPLAVVNPLSYTLDNVRPFDSAM